MQCNAYDFALHLAELGLTQLRKLLLPEGPHQPLKQGQILVGLPGWLAGWLAGLSVCLSVRYLLRKLSFVACERTEGASRESDRQTQKRTARWYCLSGCLSVCLSVNVCCMGWYRHVGGERTWRPGSIVWHAVQQLALLGLAGLDQTLLHRHAQLGVLPSRRDGWMDKTTVTAVCVHSPTYPFSPLLNDFLASGVDVWVEGVHRTPLTLNLTDTYTMTHSIHDPVRDHLLPAGRLAYLPAVSSRATPPASAARPPPADHTHSTADQN